MSARGLFYTAAHRAMRYYWRVRKPITFGVRGLVTDDANRVLLVRHTYLPGWYMPGGGADFGETSEEALRRELIEEVGVTVTGDVTLLGVHTYLLFGRTDHVALYHVPTYEKRSVQSPEIAEEGFFAIEELPAETSPKTRERILDFFGSGDGG